MGTGLFLLALAALLNGAAFFGLRYLAARVSGVRGAQAVLGADHREAWAGVSLARRALFAVAGPIGCYLCAACFITFGLTAAGSQVVDEESMRVVVVAGGPAERGSAGQRHARVGQRRPHSRLAAAEGRGREIGQLAGARRGEAA